MTPLSGSRYLHQLSKMRADSRDIRRPAGIQAVGGFVKYDADLRRKVSADKGLVKSASYCLEQQ